MNLYHYYEPDGRVVHVQTATPESALQTAEFLNLPMVEGDGLTRGYVRFGKLVAFPPQPSLLHTFDYSSCEWVDPRTMEDRRAVAWKRIKDARSAAEQAGVFVGELGTFDTDEASLLKMTSVMATLPYTPDDWTVEWTRADNTTIPLNKTNFVIVAMSALQHGKEVHAIGVALRAQVAQARTIEELDAIQWPT